MSEVNPPNTGSEPSSERPRYGERASATEAAAASTEPAPSIRQPEPSSSTQPAPPQFGERTDEPRYGERVAQSGSAPQNEAEPQPQYGERVAQPETPPAAPAAAAPTYKGYTPVVPGQPYPGASSAEPGQPYSGSYGQPYGASTESPQYSYGQPPSPYSQPRQPARFNTLAIVAFIVVFLSNLIGLILGIIALVQVNKTGERGRGLAIAAIVIGAVVTIAAIVIVVFYPNLISSLATYTSSSSGGTPA